tara:strand:- start:13767 stop:15134 length:1368 start_codon:yes stop_codon:yes gene_type:complete
MNKLQEFESQCNFDAFKYNGENIWPILRYKLGMKLMVQQNSSEEINKKKKRTTNIKFALSFFINLIHLFKLFSKYDYVYFTAQDDYRVIDEVRFNRFTHYLSKKLYKNRILEIQSGFILEKESNIENITYVSSNVLSIIAFVLSKFLRIRDIEVMKKELSKHQINLELESIIKYYLAQKKIYTFLFKNIKPKQIFFTCYTLNNEIKCANDLNIDSVEFQHAKLVNHFGYDLRRYVNPLFYPKHLCSFGDFEKEYLKDKYYLTDVSSVYPIGNFMIHLNNKRDNKVILKLKDDFKIIICVSLQWTIFNETLEFVNKIARENTNICFILMPRSKSDLAKLNINLDNVKVFEDINTYEVIKNSDIHLTCYSSCAFEAPSLGVPNIFWNYNSLSVIYYEEYINKYEFNSMINKSEDIENTLLKLLALKKETIIEKNKYYNVKNYHEKFDFFFDKLTNKN